MGLALVVNVGIVAFLFRVIPAEVRENVSPMVVVSISDYRPPEMEDEPPYEPPENESDVASKDEEHASSGSTGCGTSSEGTGIGRWWNGVGMVVERGQDIVLAGADAACR